MNMLNSSALYMSLSNFDNPLPDYDYIDGGFIVRGKTTLYAVPPASGKTTSALSASINGATRGLFNLFGRRQYERKLRCMIVSSEETVDDFIRKIRREYPDRINEVREAIKDDMLRIMSLKDLGTRRIFSGTAHLFNEHGHPTVGDGNMPSAFDVFRMECVEWRPDFIFIDTLSNCSLSEYLDALSPYATIGALDEIATKVNAAILLSMHMNKEAGKLVVDEKMPAAAALSSIRGSGQLLAATRSAIVMLEATGGAFRSVDDHPDDKYFAFVLKSNLGNKHAMKVQPVKRCHIENTFVAVVNMESGDKIETIKDQKDRERRERFVDLHGRLPRLIYAAAASGSPFVDNRTNRFSLIKSIESTLRHAFLPGTTAEEIQVALDSLLAEGTVVRAKHTVAGGTGLLDVADGPFATCVDNQIPFFKKGAPNQELLLLAAEAGNMSEVMDLVSDFNKEAKLTEVDKKKDETHERIEHEAEEAIDAIEHEAPATTEQDIKQAEEDWLRPDEVPDGVSLDQSDLNDLNNDLF